MNVNDYLGRFFILPLALIALLALVLRGIISTTFLYSLIALVAMLAPIALLFCLFWLLYHSNSLGEFLALVAVLALVLPFCIL